MNQPTGMSAGEIARAREVLHGGAGRELLRVAAQYVQPLFWARPSATEAGGQVLNSGTAFFIEFGGSPLAVTAAHVVRGWEKDYAADPTIVCQLGDLPFNPTKRLIAIDDALDLCTLRISEAEVERLGSWIHQRSPAMWPPPPPDVGRGVFLAGFLGVYRSEPEPLEVRFGLYGGLMEATDVVPGRIVVQIERAHIEDVLGLGLPDPGLNLGGLSGAPLWTLTDIGWRPAGVIFETGSDLAEVIFARHCRHLRADGQIVPG